MTKAAIGSGEVVSPQVYGLILSSRELQQMLLPQGLSGSAYEILGYDATLILHDERGARATFQRNQHIRFLQDGVAGILDHAWGEGVLLTNYRHSAGLIEDSFKDQGYRHLVIGLKRPMRRGEELRFVVQREAMEAFTQDEEWLETTIDHPIQQLSRRIVFPRSRPVQRAVLRYDGREVVLPIFRQKDGRTLIGVQVSQPRPHVAYTLVWSW